MPILYHKMGTMMEALLLHILRELKKPGQLDDKRLAQIIRSHNRAVEDNTRHLSKKKLLPYYLKVKQADPVRWASWQIDEQLEQQLLLLLRVKPQRTASGVATISVITKPWPCSSNCLYCPNDLRMPKSYLSDEPACQRAERNYFDPYLQVSSRLRALTQMGHATDKIELIVLGGTWCDYPVAYQLWFVSELFRALNDGDLDEQSQKDRRRLYKQKGLSNRPEELIAQTRALQQEVNEGHITFNQGIERLYVSEGPYADIAREQVADINQLVQQQTRNETAAHRMVGLVIETRPDTITAPRLTLLRQLGCTKVQMGIQSLDPELLKHNKRFISLGQIEQSFELLRLFGFKTHVHFMLNLFGSNAEKDIHDYLLLVTHKAYLPDEVKLYPCVLVEGTGLCEHYRDGSWQPYGQDELVRVLTADLRNTPSYVRVSRMIRDISAKDIVAGNKMANIRQLVELGIEKSGERIQEIRYREIKTSQADMGSLSLETLEYGTTVSQEFFLQWVTPDNRIAGFLRLSLPKQAFVRAQADTAPVGLREAMIREVHVYGRVAQLHKEVAGAQHRGLGRQLVDAACDLARARGFTRMNVISSVGTRQYYRGLGFEDHGLYQQRRID